MDMYWRMQLHPSDAKEAIAHTVRSLAAGYIGLDFSGSVPDMLTIEKDALPEKARNYWAFAHDMEIGDYVLVFCHHFPFALVRVAGEYNHIRASIPENSVWFTHFRKVDEIQYYGDRRGCTDARNWPYITMTATITPLKSEDKMCFKLIEDWLAKDAELVG
jgi:hypothetical protein